VKKPRNRAGFVILAAVFAISCKGEGGSSSDSPGGAALGPSEQALGTEPRHRELYPFRSGSQWGYVDATGTFQIAATFERALPFSEGFAPVRKDGLWGFVSPKGSWVVPALYENASPHSDGLARVKKDGLWGYIDRDGEMRIPPRFDIARPFSGGLAAAGARLRLGYIDKTGSFVIKPIFEKASYFIDDVAKVRFPGGPWAVVNSRGDFVLREIGGKEVEGVTEVIDGRAFVRLEEDGVWRLVDGAGDFVGDGVWDQAFAFDKGVAIVWDRKGAYLIGRDGKPVKGAPKIDRGVPAGHGLFVVEVDGRSGYLDATGRWFHPPTLRNAGSFDRGARFANVQTAAGPGLLLLDGRVVLPK